MTKKDIIVSSASDEIPLQSILPAPLYQHIQAFASPSMLNWIFSLESTLAWKHHGIEYRQCNNTHCNLGLWNIDNL